MGYKGYKYFCLKFLIHLWNSGKILIFNYRSFPRERHTAPPPPPTTLTSNFHFMFLGLQIFRQEGFDEKISFATISFKLGSSYVPAYSKMKKKNSWNVLKLILIYSREKSVQKKCCPKNFNKSFFLRFLSFSKVFYFVLRLLGPPKPILFEGLNQVRRNIDGNL